MKKIILVLVYIGLQHVYAQKPETVYSFAKEWKGEEWYLDQQKAWKKEVDKNKSNQEAWMNYYYATRALSSLSDESGKYHDERQKIVTDVNKIIPKSFAAYFLTHMDKGVGQGGEEELLKAAAIDDNYPRIVESLMIHYELENNPAMHTKYAQKMYQINDLSSGMLNWGYNLLAEMEPNAILLTMGDNDTYATWIVQAVFNFRTDVTVVNAHLFTIDNYRNQLLKNWNYKPLDVQIAKATQEEAKELQNKIYNYLISGSRPVSIVAGGVPQFKEKWGDQLFLTGLAYRISQTPIDNLSIIKRNYENRFLLDHLYQNFEFHIMNEHDKYLGGSYLPSLIRLYEHFKLSEDKVNSEKYATLIKMVAKKSEREEEIKAIFE